MSRQQHWYFSLRFQSICWLSMIKHGPFYVGVAAAEVFLTRAQATGWQKPIWRPMCNSYIHPLLLYAILEKKFWIWTFRIAKCRRANTTNTRREQVDQSRANEKPRAGGYTILQRDLRTVQLLRRLFNLENWQQIMISTNDWSTWKVQEP